MKRATDKQIAYLKYMRYGKPESLTKEEASAVISKLGRDLPDDKIDEFTARQRKWSEAKFELYPDLYRDEKEFQLVDELHQYVRTRVVGASERLTKEKVEKVIKELSEQDLDWWRSPGYKEAFFEALGKKHPGCVDGTPPQKKTYSKKQESNSSGCMSLMGLAFCVGILLTLILTKG